MTAGGVGDDSRRVGDDSRRVGDDSRRVGDDSRRVGDDRRGGSFLRFSLSSLRMRGSSVVILCRCPGACGRGCAPVPSLPLWRRGLSERSEFRSPHTRGRGTGTPSGGHAWAPLVLGPFAETKGPRRVGPKPHNPPPLVVRGRHPAGEKKGRAGTQARPYTLHHEPVGDVSSRVFPNNAPPNPGSPIGACP